MTLMSQKRIELHRSLIESGALVYDSFNTPSVADSSQKSSVDFARGMFNNIGNIPTGNKLAGQTAGKNFEAAVAIFLNEHFNILHHLRPGSWNVENIGSSRKASHLSSFEPYTHLSELARAVEANPELQSALGNGYMISPDIIISRSPEPDSNINNGNDIVNDSIATQTIIREVNNPTQILHAVISCKWTIRSDRAQNSRSEALNLVRNRKGRLPHIAVVTAEPSPSRIASVALGTGDLDMVYHLALPELVASIHATGNDEASLLIDTMVSGQRLRDISDLPLDLTV